MKTNKPKFIFILFFTILCFTSFSQSTYKLDTKSTFYIDNSMIECIYNYTVLGHSRADSTKKTEAITYKTILQSNSIVSKFWDWHSYKMDSIIFTSDSPLPIDSFYKIHSDYYMRVQYLYIPVLLKNYPKEKMTIIDDIAPDFYLYEQVKPQIIWNIEEDTMTICGYLCSKAVTNYGGRDWAVWYTPEIAISDGPWKLYGLPGLILKAKDSTGEHEFNAIAIRNSKNPIYLTNDFERIKIKKEKFMKQKLDFDLDPFRNIKLNPTVKDLMIMKETAVIINSKRSSILYNLIYSPIELK